MVEIQIHPSDIKKNVRYYFLTRTRLALTLAAAGAVAAVLVWTMAIAPFVIHSVWQAGNYDRNVVQHGDEEERLDRNLRSMERLRGTVEAHRAALQKLYFVYGLPMKPAGLGGFPPRPEPLKLEEGFTDQHPEVLRALALEAELRSQMSVLDSFFLELSQYEASHRDVLANTPSICPIKGDFVLTSPFGARISPFTRQRDLHTALDMAAPEGTRVVAAAAAEVTFAGRYPLKESVNWWRYGNVVVLRHGDRFITIYAHLADVAVRKGDRVERGERIGTVGSTGWSTSPHLHYEVRTNMVTGDRSDSGEKPGEDRERYLPVDPRIYILNHAWTKDDLSLIRNRTIVAYNDFNPLPSIFEGK